jgi:hypothetical protein
MSNRTLWTPARDAQLRRLRAEGAEWAAIAAAFGLTSAVVRERGRRIGAYRPPREQAPTPQDVSREPLPAGHPITWGALIAGTVLESCPYPLPVFLR